jgi:hypothetical protein
MYSWYRVQKPLEKAASDHPPCSVCDTCEFVLPFSFPHCSMIWPGPAPWVITTVVSRPVSPPPRKSKTVLGSDDLSGIRIQTWRTGSSTWTRTSLRLRLRCRSGCGCGPDVDGASDALWGSETKKTRSGCRKVSASGSIRY